MIEVDSSDDSTSSNDTVKTLTSNHTRRIINSAIYIEKPASNTSSNENTSIYQKSLNDETAEQKLLRTKRCSCSTNPHTCPCHPEKTLSRAPTNPHTCPCHPEETPPRARDIKTKSASKVFDNKTKLSQTSTNVICHTEKDTAIKSWIAKKDELKRKQLLQEKKLREEVEKQKQALLQQERINFEKWLTNKKKAEMEAKKRKQKDAEEKQLKELEKEKRQLQNEISFKLWVKRKEEACLERKIKEQMALITELEKKQSQIVDNEKAFKDWLKNSKDKPKPVALNKGLESLCSSSSITYINPNPWNPP